MVVDSAPVERFRCPGCSVSAETGFGARVQAVAGSATRNDLRDGVSVTSPVVRSSGSGSTTTDYLPGVGERRGTTISYGHSGLKNNDTQTNSSAAVSATREYDAWGNVLATTGSFAGPFGHAGDFGYQADGSGLQLLGHRYYDPEVGRFISRDPAQDGRNWFAYCDNNPLTNADPKGLWFETAVDVVGTGVSINDMVKEPSWANAGFLVWDVVAVLVPFVPGSWTAKVGKAGAKVAAKIDDVADVASASDKIGEVLETAKGTVRLSSKLDDALGGGVYVVQRSDGAIYVGTSKHIKKRLKQHGDRFTFNGVDATVMHYATPDAATKAYRETAEQLFLDAIRQKHPSLEILNKVNPLGPKRRHFIDAFKFN